MNRYTPEQQTILIVDDTPEYLFTISNLLKDRYKVKVANNGERALKLAQTESIPDIILLDVMMPNMDGYETCARLKANQQTQDIPIIFLTAKTDEADETHGFEIGAEDYIAKPISPPVLLARLETHLKLKQAQDCLKNHNQYLESQVEKRTREIAAIEEATILALACLAETRDNETGNHLTRTQLYVKILAEKLRDHPRFKDYLNDNRAINMLYKSAPLHDIGKVGIPDHILLKPGALSKEEFDIMKTHSTLGRNAIVLAEERLGLDLPFLSIAKEIVYSHHEKWNGTGYPEGLSGDDIPISARLLAIADVYDALITKRVYKEAIPHDQAIQIIKDSKCAHFDPDMVDAFVELASEVEAIARRFDDKNSND